MDVKHFMRMVLGLIGMAIVGLIGLVLVNHYSKGETANVAPSSQNTLQNVNEAVRVNTVTKTTKPGLVPLVPPKASVDGKAQVR